MRKIKIGDIFSIETSKGFSFFQYVYYEETIGELIYIFPELHNQVPDLNGLKNDLRGFFIHFPVRAALNRKLIRYVENSSLPEYLEIPLYFKTEVTDLNGNVIDFQIVDYKTWRRYSKEELKIELERLSPWGVWNDTYLIEYILEKWG